MIKLSITTKDTSITAQDPRPVTQANEEQAVISVEPSSTKSVIMQWGQLERIANQLQDMAEMGLCTFAIESTGGAGFVEQADAPDNPSIDLVTGAVLAAGATGILVTGNNLLAGQELAELVINGDAATGTVTVTSLVVGYAGNDIDVEVIDTGSAGLAVSSAVVAGRTVITVNLGASATEDCSTVAAAITAAMVGTVKAVAGGTTTDLIATVRALAPLTGGVGTGLSVTLAGAACTITDIDLSGAPIEVITIDTPAIGTVADVAKLKVLSDAKESLASVILG